MQTVSEQGSTWPGRRAAACLLAGAVIFGCGTLALPARASGCGASAARAGSAAPSNLAAATVCLLNRERAARGLRPLRTNGSLSRAGARHASYMVRARYFSHYARNGYSFSDWIRSAGYLHGARSWALGETIGWGPRGGSAPRSIVRAWMQSPPHRAVILSPAFSEVGVGVAEGSPTGRRGRAGTYAGEFGHR